jgi:tripartite-type tricarboxylate transporter receptor subunit TctC
MKLPRRRFLHLAAGAAALPAISWAARAQSYPTRTVRLILGNAPGGGVDIVARLVGQWLSERLGQPFIIDNRPGAATNIGTEAAAKAAPDGHTLFLATASNAVNATFYEKLNFNFIADFAPVAGIMRVPQVMVVNPSFPAKTVPEFIAYAKANPDKINMASAGAGGTDHMAGELLKIRAGVSMTHVPYRGLSPALSDLLGGQVQVVFSSIPAAIEYIKAGRLLALAVTGAMRSQALPEIPTVGDFFPHFEASQWYGVAAPKNTRIDIVDRLNKEINAALADPKMKARLAELGGMPLPGSPLDFGKLIAAETEKWAKVIRAAGIRAE